MNKLATGLMIAMMGITLGYAQTEALASLPIQEKAAKEEKKPALDNIPAAKLLAVNQDNFILYLKEDHRVSASRNFQLCSFLVGTEIREYLLPTVKALVPMKMYQLEIKIINNAKNYKTSNLATEGLNIDSWELKDNRVIDKNLDGIIMDYKLLRGPK